MMTLLASMLLTGSTLTRVPAPHPDLPAASAQFATLRTAALEAARRQGRSTTLNIPRDAPAAFRQRRPQRRHHYSLATRITAIAAGSIAGAVGGLVAGAAIGGTGGEEGAIVGMVYGTPIGAAAGGVLTAYYVR